MTYFYGDDKLLAVTPDPSDYIKPQILLKQHHVNPEEFDENGVFIVPKEIEIEKVQNGMILKCDMANIDILRRFLEGGFLTINEVRAIYTDFGIIDNKQQVFLETDQIRQKVDWRDFGIVKEVQTMNCRNCGAPVPKNGTCEYCGTHY